MITLNDVFKGKIIINPKYIDRIKPANPHSNPGLKGAKTWINYLEPSKNAVHYYVIQSMDKIQK